MKTTIPVALALIAALPAAAQNYPTRPIRVIVPFTPGGGTDIVARIMGQRLGERFGQQVVVDNRPGAAGSVGTDATVKSPPDGYTMLTGSTSEIGIGPSLYSKLPYDVLRDLVAVSALASTPMVLVVHPVHPLARRPRVEVAELATCHLLVREQGSMTREATEASLRAAGTGMPLYRDIRTEAPDYEPLPYYSSEAEEEMDLATWLATANSSRQAETDLGILATGAPVEGAPEAGFEPTGEVDLGGAAGDEEQAAGA